MDMEMLTLTWATAKEALDEIRTWGGNAHPERFAGCRTPRWRARLEQLMRERLCRSGWPHPASGGAGLWSRHQTRQEQRQSDRAAHRPGRLEEPAQRPSLTCCQGGPGWRNASPSPSSSVPKPGLAHRSAPCRFPCWRLSTPSLVARQRLARLNAAWRRRIQSASAKPGARVGVRMAAASAVVWPSRAIALPGACGR